MERTKIVNYDVKNLGIEIREAVESGEYSMPYDSKIIRKAYNLSQESSRFSVKDIIKYLVNRN